MKLIDLAKILRSKNAGPLYITFDIIFNNEEDLQTALKGLFFIIRKKRHTV